MEMLPQGLWPVMLTPFRPDNTVDVDGLAALTEFYLTAGADGLFANCLSSEMFQLTEHERLLVTRTVLETVDGRVPVVATGSFGTDTAYTAAFAGKLHQLGVAAVVISTSEICDELHDLETFRDRVQHLLEITGDIPLGLYECPVPFKRLLPPDLLGWLAHTGRFLYHKDTSCDIAQLRQKIEAVRGTPLGVYNAHVPTALDSLLAGARGISPIGANLYPELFRLLVDLMNEGRREDELRVLTDSLDLMDSVIHHNYPYLAKRFLQRRGLPISPACRVPRLRLSHHDLHKLETIMATCQQLARRFSTEASSSPQS